MTRAAAPASRAKPYINVTPFIDILLVLLIIFMVITPVKPSRFKALVPPQTPPVEPPPDPHPLALVVAVDHERRLLLNTQAGFGSIDDPARLVAELTRIFHERRENGVRRTLSQGSAGASASDGVERTVFIKAPRALPYGEVAHVIDAVRDAGASPVGLQIDDLN